MLSILCCGNPILGGGVVVKTLVRGLVRNICLRGLGAGPKKVPTTVWFEAYLLLRWSG